MQQVIEAPAKTGENWCAGHNGFLDDETYHCIVYSDFCRQVLPTALCVQCAALPVWREKLRQVKYWYNTRLLSEVYVAEAEEDVVEEAFCE